MVELYGRTLSRRDLAERTGMLAQIAGVRLVSLGDGLERGNRVLEFRTGGGLVFNLMVDRGFDVAGCDYRGHAIGWHSPAGFRHPSLHDHEGEAGLAFVRAFSGLLATCGLDHTMAPAEVSAEHYNYPGRKTVRHSLHGRVSMIPARLSGYGEAWDGDRCTLWAEGVVQQSAMFGEDLYLFRRVEAEVGGRTIRVLDRVENHGFLRTPHMLFYHVNVGWPLLDEGARYLAPIRDVLWASHAASYRAQGVGFAQVVAPRNGFREQVWEHDLGADTGGESPAALLNDRLGLGFEVVTRKDQLPCFYEWQNYQAGNYALGIEPSTHHILGEPAAWERNEVIWLEHGESRRYELTMRVLDGAREIAATERRIAGIARQPDEEYPAPSGQFAPLRGSL